MKRGIIAPKPVVMVTESGDEAAIESVKQTAEQGVSLAQNARAMARNVGDRVASVEEQALTLQQLADDYLARVAESVADRADLRSKIDNIQLTPGPEGKPGAEGKPGTDGKPGLDGVPGKDGATGAPGKDYDPAVATALSARISTLEAGKPLAFGMATTPTLALLATADLTIPLSRQMPDTDYTIELAKTAVIRDDMLTLKAKTRTSVIYTLKAVIALQVAGTLAVIARY